MAENPSHGSSPEWLRQDFELAMDALGGRRRTIRVLAPPLSAGERCGVLYMTDGQNLFSDAEASYGTCWNIPATLAALGLQIMVVGVDSGEGLGRLDELSPWSNDWIRHQSDSIQRVVGGEGAAYASFVADQLKPLIDREWPTRGDRAHSWLAGSSMGGLSSLYQALARPEVFSRVACFSSAFWFAAAPLRDWVAGLDRLPERAYLDVGTREQSRRFNEAERLEYINDTRAVHELLAARGLGTDRLSLVIEEGGEHGETAWSRRFPAAIRWLLADQQFPAPGTVGLHEGPPAA